MSDGGPSRRRRWVALVLVVAALLGVRRVRQLDPRLIPPSGAGLRGLALYELGDYAGAAAAYRTHLRQAMDSVPPVDDAEVALLGGHPERARHLAAEALKEDPDDVAAMLTLADAALETGAPAAAARWLARALHVAPRDFDALVLAAIAEAELGSDGQAIDLLNRALRGYAPERESTFLHALALTGRLGRRPAGERPTCLLAHLHRYLRIFDPTHARLAIAYAEEAIAAGDRPDDAYLTLGIVRSKQAGDDEALAAFLAAIEANPRHAEAHRWAAVAYEQRGDLVREHRMLRRAYELAPDDPTYAVQLGYLLAERLGDYRGALEVASRRLPMTPEDPALLHQLGYLHAMIGEFDEGRRFYQLATAAAPGDPVHPQGIAWVLARQGHSHAAADAYRQALALAPGSQEIRRQLGLLYRDDGRFEEAAHELERAHGLLTIRRRYLLELCFTYQLAARFERARSCAREVLTTAANLPEAQRLLAFSLRDVTSEAPAR